MGRLGLCRHFGKRFVFLFLRPLPHEYFLKPQLFISGIKKFLRPHVGIQIKFTGPHASDGIRIIFGELGWRSGESARLPPMCPGFDFWTRRHIWVEFVVGSRPSSEGFSPGSPVFLPL